MTVAFEPAGQHFTALNGGPQFPFTEAISLPVNCETQDEIDHYWGRLSWQIAPDALSATMRDPDPARRSRVMAALLQMQKLVIADLRRAYDG